MFIAAANRTRVQSRFLAGAPDLVVEVISGDSVARDMETKRAEYAAAGIREYWLIESREPFRWAKFLVLHDGEYVEVPVVDGVYHSEAADGFWLRTDWLWDVDLRSVEALREILERRPEAPAGE
jgi:Uma2 family endonuclease